MKILLISTSDRQGGAAIAVYRLHQSLKTTGINSQMLVQAKLSDDESVFSSVTAIEKGMAKLKPALDYFPLKFSSRGSEHLFSLQWFPERLTSKIASLNPDLINLHWTNHGYLQIETLAKFQKPLVWTLHDMWVLTGGCHYSQECDRYKYTCGKCPQLDSNSDWDFSRWVWQRKAKAWRNLNLTLVSPSSWLAQCARNSSLFKDTRIEVIPNGIDIQRYKPIDQDLARKWLNLPQNKFIILFGASSPLKDPRKGFSLLQAALQKLSQTEWQEKLELVIFGASQPRLPPNIGIKTHYIGQLKDDISLSLVYGAADVFVSPSVQDNLSNTVIEALACGTPCVAFKIGGMSDMIEHQSNGYLAQPLIVEDLAKGIIWVLENPERYQFLSQQARQKVEQQFSQETQAMLYLSLFEDILN